MVRLLTLVTLFVTLAVTAMAQGITDLTRDQMLQTLEAQQAIRLRVNVPFEPQLAHVGRRAYCLAADRSRVVVTEVTPDTVRRHKFFVCLDNGTIRQGQIEY